VTAKTPDPDPPDSPGPPGPSGPPAIDGPDERPAEVLRRLRYVSLAGFALWASAALLFATLAWKWSRQAGAVALAAGVFLYSGKVGSIPVGQSAGGEPWLVALVIWAIDVGALLILFPLTQAGVEALQGRGGRVSRWVARATQGAESRRAWVDRWGPYGLFAFSLFPVYLNSPLVGATVGRLARLRPSRTLLALVSAMTLMNAVWTVSAWLALREARALDPRLAWAVGLAFGAPPLAALGVRAAWRRLRAGRSRAA
jgi:uncharacterized membrane protein